MGKKITLTDFELPDGFESAEDLIKKITELTGKVPTLEQQAALAAKFEKWGNPDDLEARLNLWVQKQVAEQVEKAKAAGATKKEAEKVGDKTADAIYERWAELSPADQVNFILSQVTPGIQSQIEGIAKNYWAEAQKQIQAASGTSQQQFDLMARGLDLMQRNPGLKMADVWKVMTEIATATPDKLMDIALKNVQVPQERETWEKEARAKWDAEAKDKQAAENLKVLNSDSVPSWLKPKEERVSLNKDGEDALKNSILSKHLQNGSLRPEQI